MALTQDFIDVLSVMARQATGPRYLPWPMHGYAGAIQEFRTFADWRDFFLALRLPQGIPANMADAFDRALKVALLSWIDGDLFVAAELAALSALEHALRDCYLGEEKKRRLAKAMARARQEGRTLTEEDNEKAGRVLFGELLKIMTKEEKLTDEMIPLAKRCNLKVIPLLTGEIRFENGTKQKVAPTLADMRNIRAHGNPSGDTPTAGLIELARDLMAFAYRNRINEADRNENTANQQR